MNSLSLNAIQIARCIFDNASTCVAALQLDLEASEGFKLRPATLTEVLAIFPKGFYDTVWGMPDPKPGSSGSSKSKLGSYSMGGFLKGTDVTAEEVAGFIRKFRDATVGKMGDEKAKKGRTAKTAASTAVRRPSRTDDNMAARVCAVTTAHLPATITRLKRDLMIFCAVGLAEHYLVETVRYRQALLPTALGELRLKFHAILDPCVKTHLQATPNGNRTITSWVFLDRLETPADAKASRVNLKTFHANARRTRDRESNRLYLRGLRVKIENHPGTWASPEDDEDNNQRALDHEVSEHANSMLEAIWTNMERILHRNFVNDDEAPFNVQNQAEIPPECLTQRGSLRDAHTVDESFAVRRRTPKNARNARKSGATTPATEELDQLPIKAYLPTQKTAPSTSHSAGADLVSVDNSAAPPSAAASAPSSDLQWADEGPNFSWSERRARLEAIAELKTTNLTSIRAKLTSGGLIPPAVSRPNMWTKDQFKAIFDAALSLAIANSPDPAALVDSSADPAIVIDAPPSPSPGPASRSQSPMNTEPTSVLDQPAGDNRIHRSVSRSTESSKHSMARDTTEERSRKKARLDVKGKGKAKVHDSDDDDT